MSISISKLRAQIDVSTPGGSPPADLWMSATCDSPMPYVRMSQRALGVARANTSASAGCPGASSQRRRSSDGTPGRTTTTRPVDGQDEARRGSRHPEHGRSIRHVRLLSVSGVETGPVEPVADGDLIGPAVDPLEDVRIEHQVDAGDVRERLDGAVVVGGPEPT